MKIIASEIRENGGFYEIGKTLSTDENAKMAFSIIPTESKSLLQLRVSTTSPIENQIESGTEINPLEFFNINEIHYDLNGTKIGEDEDALYFTSNFPISDTKFVFDLDVDPSISTDKNIENIHKNPEFIINGNDLLNNRIEISSTVTETARLIDFTELTSRLWQGAGPDLGGSADTCTLIYTTNWNSNDKIIENLNVGSDTIETFKNSINHDYR